MPTDPQMLKGVLAMLLLSVLAEQQSYGYEIVTRLRALGFVELAEGTVYPALTRLETAGDLQSRLVKSTSGPARKYYRTTDQGRAALARRRTDWQDLVSGVSAVIAHAEPGQEDS